MSQAPTSTRRGNGAGTHGRGRKQQHGKPCRWRARAKPESRQGQAGPGRVAERFVLPERPGNAGGGKGPQVRRGEGKREGRREWQCLGPRYRVRESWNHRMRKRREANAGTSASRGGRRRRQGVNRPAARCGDRREEAGGVRLPRRGRHQRTRHSRRSWIYPCASGMIPLESPVPESGTPGSVSGERKRG